MKKEIDIKKDLYLCCPLLNKECKKDNCYINDGDCRLTTNKEYSQQELIDKIDKAIEYIENSDDNENSYGDYDIEYHFKKELLNILKGSDSND